MEQLEITTLPRLRKDSPQHLIADALDALPRQAIDKAPWPDQDEEPEVAFAMAHNEDCLFLKYYVKENTVQAKYRKINDTVYKDSCVEFFIAFGGEEDYYNFEFNCLGTCRVGFGPNRNDRKLLSKYKISQIRHWAALKVVNRETPKVTWQLTLAIPTEVFSEHTLRNFREEQGRANFYKCGDELASPHYLSWSAIESPQPNFHLPEFFREIKFL